MTLTADIARLRTLDAKRTDGAWGIGYINDDRHVMDVIAQDSGEVIADEGAEHNAGFIAAAPDMMNVINRQAALLARCREAISELVALKDIHDAGASAMKHYSYHERKPKAWREARDTLAALDEAEGKPLP